MTGWVLDFGASRVRAAPVAGGRPRVLGRGPGPRGARGGGRPARPGPRTRAALAWQAKITPAELAAQIGAQTSEVDAALAALGSQGLVGYDLEDAGYFHREMPFDLSKVEALHPRLANARRLVEAGAVRLASNEGKGTEAFVNSGGVEHRVVLEAETFRCSCPWFNRMKGEAGPCKHVLAVRLARDEQEPKAAAL